MEDTLPMLRDFRPEDAVEIAQLVTASVRGHWTYIPEHFTVSVQPGRFRTVAQRLTVW
ncbi:hypothetical protein [Deinococcus alpinitundrae]|uniref:hypothetical protein n=1 Tax=Deinococcus alpinitundrae TaxID=468913 RepID=UPI00137AF4B8|nr:hypothetical protein [Deinococcus alpinitundrae]